jgi:hypothetical protein
MEVALRSGDNNREWLASLDQCIAKDSSRDNYGVGTNSNPDFDQRILHLPVLWKTYHDRLKGGQNAFWVAQVREAMQKRLDVAMGKAHSGYSIETAKSAWDKDSIAVQRDSWNDDVLDDHVTKGESLGGAEH